MIKFGFSTVPGRRFNDLIRYGVVLGNSPRFTTEVPDVLQVTAFLGNSTRQKEAIHTEGNPW
jgi:hypothetical protein